MGRVLSVHSRPPQRFPRALPALPSHLACASHTPPSRLACASLTPCLRFPHTSHTPPSRLARAALAPCSRFPHTPHTSLAPCPRFPHTSITPHRTALAPAEACNKKNLLHPAVPCGATKLLMPTPRVLYISLCVRHILPVKWKFRWMRCGLA
jgi:hypothetical protein